jgi:hypothetical protein
LPSDPHAQYSSRRQARLNNAWRLQRLHVRLGNLRLGMALSFAVMLWLAVIREALSPWWLLVPAGFFIALVVRDGRVQAAQAHAERAAAFYDQGLARLEDRWAGSGQPGDRFRDPNHPYAEDLDLFGKGGLFELLSTCRTPLGEDALARWLLHPSAPEAVRERQEAVSDLRGRLDLREDLAVLEEDVRAGVHPEALVRWAEEAPILVTRRGRAAAVLLSLTAAAGGFVWAATGLATPLLLVFTAELALWYRLRQRLDHVVYGVEKAAPDLFLLAEVLERIEREPFEAPRLAALRAALETGGLPPSRRIHRLNRLVELLDSRDNWFVRIFGPPLLYTPHLAFAVESWRRANGREVRAWLEAVAELEALSALAGYAYEHPADPFPELTPDGALFEAEEIGHPLLPAARCVRNSLRLGGDLRVIVVSGSNMSGKSTLLRTVGVNAVLAMAGAPVRASRLRLAPLTVGASIRVMDSLQGGSSRFYAEISRLRQLMDLAAGQFPLLFLLDELLHGTNSHDRRIGAEAAVRGLVERGAIGLVTTHDLALAHVAEVLAPRGSNAHFEDHLENGRMLFDYRLRPGVVEKSNALELMRSIGLEV